MKSRFLFGFLALSVVPWSAEAQGKVPATKAQIVVAETQVYAQPDFDSKVIAVLPGGGVFPVSIQKYNQAFHRIQVKAGVQGYVSDAEIKLLNKAAQKKSQELSDASSASSGKREPEKNRRKKQRPFQYTQFAGLQYAYLQFVEDTMGDKRKENLGFFGAKISGPNLIIEGEMPSEINFLFHYGAPSYYEKLTGRKSDGFILMMDFLWQNYYPQSANSLAFFGFGPMIRYSKINAGLTDVTTGKTTDYSLEDLAFGGVFNAGLAVRMNQVSLRGELKYFWEQTLYWGAALAIQFGF